jgi:signal transduction histidine kinase
MATTRRPIRSRPIRLYLFIMFAVPLVSLVALWAFAAVVTVPSALSNQNYNRTTSAIIAAITPLSIGLPAERTDAYLWLITGRTEPETAIDASRAAVDGGLPAAKAALNTQLDQINGPARTALTTLFADLGQLPRIRSAIDAGKMTAAQAFQAYTNIIDAQFQYFYASIQFKAAAENDPAIASIDGDYAMEMTSREITLIDGVLADAGQMSAPVRELFTASATGRQLLINQTTSLLTPSLRGRFLALAQSPEARQFGALESTVLASSGSGPVPVSEDAWQSASGAYLAALQAALTADGTQLDAQSASLSDTQMAEAILAGGVGLAAVIASLILLAWFGRKVTKDMTRLDSGVREVARVQLPQLVERLRQGDDVDVPAEPAPQSGSSGIREVAQIAESFGSVQEAAVAAAVDQARLRIGINQVFRNISMRSQSLLHRQLAMLDTMERGTSDPAALGDLFRLDHLTTRMRRHAEGLIILSGASPGRIWRTPVPVVDVIRAAIAEVEDYVRVDVVSESRDLVVGGAVSDIIHLVAELVENATVFSPPNTRIEIRADRVGTGLVAEIEDRGLGLTAEERADINARLNTLAEFDLARSQQLGLYVVSRLAVRHGIKVSLRESVYGGTTAVVLLPFGVVVRAEEAEPLGEQDVWAAGNGRKLLAAPAAVLYGEQELNGEQERNGKQEWRPRPATPLEPARPAALTSQPAESQPVTGRHSAAASTQQTIGSQQATSSQQGAGTQPAAGSHLGMPVRIPQASLAAQLRTGNTGALSKTAGTAETSGAVRREVTARSPESNRDLLTLMQQGWARGRVDDLDHPQGAPGDGNDR